MNAPLSARHFVVLAGALAIAAHAVVPGLRWPVGFDATHTYLPMARRLIAEGAGFLRHPDSLATAFVSYAYPALLGANDRWIRWTNVGMYLAAIVLAFLALRAVHSNRAGLIAAFGLAISPAIHPFIPDVMTEPPFLFLTAVWIASVAWVVRGHLTGGAVAGGIAFALATLTRPAAMYFPLAAIAWFAWRAWRGRGQERRIDLALAGMHALALGILLLFIARNAITFGFPAIAAGAGNALFHGSSALVDGLDPNYYGLIYDDGAVTQGLSHLSLEGDRLLRGTGLQEFAATPLPVLAEMAVKKAIAFLFVPGGEAGVATFRPWRALLVTFALAAVVLQLRSRMVLVLAAMVGYMLAVHLPVLLNHRYSVGAIELPLAMLAGIGLAEAVKTPGRIGTVAFVATLAVAAAFASLADPGPSSPHPERAPHRLIWSSELGGTVRIDDSTRGIDLQIPNAPNFHPSSNFVVTLAAALKPEMPGAGCRALRLRYKSKADADFPQPQFLRLPVRADGRMRDVTFGATTPLRLVGEGTLRIEPECASPATLDVGRITIVEPQRATFYRARYLQKVSKGER